MNAEERFNISFQRKIGTSNAFDYIYKSDIGPAADAWQAEWWLMCEAKTFSYTIWPDTIRLLNMFILLAIDVNDKNPLIFFSSCYCFCIVNYAHIFIKRSHIYKLQKWTNGGSQQWKREPPRHDDFIIWHP